MQRHLQLAFLVGLFLCINHSLSAQSFQILPTSTNCWIGVFGAEGDIFVKVEDMNDRHAYKSFFDPDITTRALFVLSWSGERWEITNNFGNIVYYYSENNTNPKPPALNDGTWVRNVDASGAPAQACQNLDDDPIEAEDFDFVVLDGRPLEIPCTIVIDTITNTPPNCPSGRNELVITPDSASNILYSIDGGRTFQADSTFMLKAGDYEIVLSDLDIDNCTTTQKVSLEEMQDTEAPVVNCPTAQTIILQEDCRLIAMDLRPEVTVSDNCRTSDEIQLFQSPAPGSIINTGAKTVTFRIFANDRNGNFSNCEVEVVVVDETAPTISCPRKATISLNENCRLIIPDLRGEVTASDNCGNFEDLNGIFQSPAPGTNLSAGPTTLNITLFANDGNGNRTTCITETEIVDSLGCTSTNGLASNNSNLGLNHLNSSLISSLHAYPNPTYGQLTVEMGGAFDKEANLKIYNLNGQVMWEQQYAKVSKERVQLDLSALKKGVYILSLETVDRREQIRIVLQ